MLAVVFQWIHLVSGYRCVPNLVIFQYYFDVDLFHFMIWGYFAKILYKTRPLPRCVSPAEH